jgi:Protein of unknown function (DUF4019)
MRFISHREEYIMKFRSLILIALFASMALTRPLNSQTPSKPEDLAQKSAEAWLALSDTGKYAETWDEASQLFKNSVTKEVWIGAIRGVRSPLGAVQSRKLKSATFAKNLPGAPDGQYVVIQYDTSFEHKQAAIETITPMLDKDGKWRVSGYYIK